MRSLRLIAGTILTVPLLGAGVAHADASWSAPVPMDPGFHVDFPPTLTFTGDGHALATLDGSSGGQLSPVLAANPGATTFTELGPVLLLAPPTPYGRSGFAYLRAPSPPPGPHPIDKVKVTALACRSARSRARSGASSCSRDFRLRPGGESARIAADPRGNIAAAWLEPHENERRRILRVALRRPGHAFGRPITLVGGSLVSNIALAYGAKGDLVVAFERMHAFTEARADIAVRVKRHGGRFGRIQSIGPSRGYSSIATAVGAKGSAVVAWGTQDGGEEVGRPWTVARQRGDRPVAPTYSTASTSDCRTRRERSSGESERGLPTSRCRASARRGTRLGVPRS